MKPIILLTHKFSNQHWGLGRSYTVESNYCRALIRAGALPLVTAGGDPEEMAEMADGVLFTGGADIEPQRYGESNQFDITSDGELDEMELTLLKAFYAVKKPIFGICRGIQTVNVGTGGTLYQHVPGQITLSAHKPVYEDNDPRHLVHAVEGSSMESLFGKEFMTNSYHHQAVKTMSPGMKAAAMTDEGLIEAIEHESLPILAVQWHPERMIGEENNALPDMMPLFRLFTAIAEKDRDARKGKGR